MSEGARTEPARELTNQPRRTLDAEPPFVPGPRDGRASEIQIHEATGIRLDDQVLGEAGRRGADLGPVLEDHPEGFPMSVPEVETDHHSAAREAFGVGKFRRRPEHVVGLDVARLDLEPSGAPIAHGVADPFELAALLGEHKTRIPARWSSGVVARSRAVRGGRGAR